MCDGFHLIGWLAGDYAPLRGSSHRDDVFVNSFLFFTVVGESLAFGAARIRVGLIFSVDSGYSSSHLVTSNCDLKLR